MRNLKKILALVLALVMSFSLMATANAFTDDEKITDTYETAVTVLSGLKVFQGYDDGTFQPQGPITRAEVAAIIYRIVTGDVADTQVGIYADYNKFNDVKSTSWYAGYVNFCANAEYIKGYDAKTFGPNDPVTGYQALAMILRALGYDKNGEFTGTSWQVQTAAVGENRGITKNISAGTLGTAATREVVAEILFRAILVEKVNYTPAFGYQLDDTSIGWDTFELEEIEGVVVANEYADLYSTSPLKAGRTELDVDGDSYVIDYTTTLEDIGEARYAYITGGKTVLALGDAGNTVFETGAEANISGKKFENVTGLERGDETEYFVNFDGGDEYKASDWKIKYVVETNTGSSDDDSLADFIKKYGLELKTTDFKYEQDGNWSYTKTVKPGDTITDADLANIKAIFDAADADKDLIIGAVYVGTQSNEDISDEYSYKQFKDKYIETDEDAIEVTANENGNWLKVVDVDGDGVADYVLKTIYTMAGIEDIAKDGTITLSCDEVIFGNANHNDAINYVDEDIDVVAEDEVEEDNIVYYAVIDGNAYTYLAEVVTAEIDKVNRNTLTATTTDGDEYVESGVHNHIIWNGYVDGVRNMEGDINYDLYLDKYGYVAAFTESTNNAGFVLITDGYYESGRTNDTYAAKVWNGEELVDTDITDGGELFIGSHWEWDANDWGNLGWFDGINAYYDADKDEWFSTDIQTIVAALSEDGTLTPVDDLYRYREDVVMVGLGNTKDQIPNRNATYGTIYASGRVDRTYMAYAIPDGQADVRALSTTVYYYVYNTADGTVVREYVGYANTPDLGNDAWKIENIYAVASRAEDAHENDYYTAEIVVVELEDGYNQIDREEIFLVDLPVVGKMVGTEFATVIRADGTQAEVEIDLEKSEIREYDPAWDKWVGPGLYYMWESADEADVYVIAPMSWEEIADSDYLIGTVNKNTATGATDWTSVDKWFNNNDEDDFDVWSMFDVEESKKNVSDSQYYTLSYEWDTWADPDDHTVWDYVADLEDGLTYDEVLDQDVKGQELNYVIVAFDSNDIVYAISFRFDDSFLWEQNADDITSDEDDRLTFDCFAWNTPAAKGIDLTINNQIDNTKDPVVVANNDGTYTITVEPKAGYAFAGDLYATYAGVNAIKGEAQADGSVVFTTGVIAKDTTVTLTGSTALVEYDITYTVDGAEDDTLEPAEYDVTEAVELPTPTKAGYTFVGWLLNGETDTAKAVKGWEAGKTGDVAAVAVFTQETYTVTFTYVDSEGVPYANMTQTFEVPGGTKFEAYLGKEADESYVVDGKVYTSADKYVIDPVKDNVSVEVMIYVEGTVADATADKINDVVANADAGSTIYLAAGEYTMPTISKDLTFIGTEDTVITGRIDIDNNTAEKVTIQGCTIEIGEGNNGQYLANGAANKTGTVVTITDCVFVLEDGDPACCAIYLNARSGCKYVITGNTFVGEFFEGAVDIDMYDEESEIIVKGNDFSSVVGSHIYIHNNVADNLETDVAAANIGYAD